MTEQTTRISTLWVGQRHTWIDDGLKRLFDILVSFFGLLILLPVFTWVAWRIRRESPGPVFYRGARLGKDEKVFLIWKFRTMYERPESYQGTRVTAEDDPRVTPFGRWLRNTKLNELPQLWNVLKGEMSVVGPRPEDPHVATQWPIDARHEVTSIRPGITSPAAVRYRNEETLLSKDRVMQVYLTEILPSKLRLDQLYVRHRSFWTDLDIIFWTFLLLIPRLGKYQPPDRQIFLGPFASLVKGYGNWLVADFFVTLTAIGLTGLIWRSFGPLDVGWTAAIFYAFTFAVLFSSICVMFRVNRIAWSRAAASDMLDLFLPIVLATLFALIANWLFPYLVAASVAKPWLELGQPLLPHAMILLAAFFASIGFVILRYRSRLITGLVSRWLSIRNTDATTRERILIMGVGEAGQFAAWMLANGHYAQEFRVMGFVDDDMFKQGVRIHGFDVLGQRSDIPQLVEKHDIGIILFAIHNISSFEQARLINICSVTPARIVFFPDILAGLNGLARRSGAPSVEGLQSAGSISTGDIGHLPCQLCLTRVVSTRMETQLKDLQQSARAGDLDLVQVHAQALQQILYSEHAVHIEEN